MAVEILWSRAIFSSLLMGTWLYGFFLRPLAEEAAAMHNRQLDPTEIVLIPYDVFRLWLHVAMVFFLYLTTSSANLLPKQIPILLGTTACTTAAYIIYGASATNDTWHTLAAALYLMVLVQWDGPVWILHRDDESGQFVGTVSNSSSSSSSSSSLNVLERLSFAASGGGRTAFAAFTVDRLAIIQTQAVLGFTVLLHILRLYDRGWQLQRWPVPTILGATMGWIVGRWIGLITLHTSKRQKAFTGKGDL